MWILALILAGVVLAGMTAGFFYNRNIRKKIEKGELKEAPEVRTVDGECCGQHAVCEKESLLAAVSRQIEYYDDYTEEETNEFRDIMYTMKEEEVAGWCRSLQLRGVEFPDGLKDELFLIVGERRFQ